MSVMRLFDVLLLSLNHSWIKDSIVGWSSRIGKWSRLEGISVLGEDVSVADGLCVNGGIILPHKGIKDSIYTPKIVM